MERYKRETRHNRPAWPTHPSVAEICTPAGSQFSTGSFPYEALNWSNLTLYHSSHRRTQCPGWLSYLHREVLPLRNRLKTKWNTTKSSVCSSIRPVQLMQFMRWRFPSIPPPTASICALFVFVFAHVLANVLSVNLHVTLHLTRLWITVSLAPAYPRCLSGAASFRTSLPTSFVPRVRVGTCICLSNYQTAARSNLQLQIRVC